jgi:hypothetical protein
MSADTIEIESKIVPVINLIGATTMTISKECNIVTSLDLECTIINQLNLTSIVELEDV